jgi:ABC-type transporter MlaC component
MLIQQAWPAFGQTSDSVQFILGLNHKAFVQLSATTIDDAERKRRFAALVDEDLDLDAIDEHLLDWRWAKATLTVRGVLEQEFRTYLIQIFAMTSTGLDNHHLTVNGLARDKGATPVLTDVTTHGTSREPFIWRVVRTRTGWRLCDVIADNVSILAVIRSQFDAVLPDGQPDLDPLFRLLREKSPRVTKRAFLNSWLLPNPIDINLSTERRS